MTAAPSHSSSGSADMLALADEYEAGLKKMLASGYEEFGPDVLRKHRITIDALRFQASATLVTRAELPLAVRLRDEEGPPLLPQMIAQRRAALSAQAQAGGVAQAAPESVTVAWQYPLREAMTRGCMSACTGDGEHQIKITFETLEDMQEARKALYHAIKQTSPVSPTDRQPGWIDQNHQIDRYGVALMMIREGCADPSGLARRILSEFDGSTVTSTHQSGRARGASSSDGSSRDPAQPPAHRGDAA